MEKACAVPFRRSALAVEVLAFDHPLAGRQFVKGTVDPGESPRAAAIRELTEESGLELANPIALGSIAIGKPAATWHCYAFATERLPDRWQHRTADGGGLTFAFFWHPLDEALDPRWHPMFHRVHAHVRSTLLAVDHP